MAKQSVLHGDGMKLFLHVPVTADGKHAVSVWLPEGCDVPKAINNLLAILQCIQETLKREQEQPR